MARSYCLPIFGTAVTGTPGSIFRFDPILACIDSVSHRGSSYHGFRDHGFWLPGNRLFVGPDFLLVLAPQDFVGEFRRVLHVHISLTLAVSTVYLVRAGSCFHSIIFFGVLAAAWLFPTSRFILSSSSLQFVKAAVLHPRPRRPFVAPTLTIA